MIVEKLNEIINILSKTEADAKKAENGNASAARRTRKELMIVTKEIKELRAIILERIKKWKINFGAPLTKCQKSK